MSKKLWCLKKKKWSSGGIQLFVRESKIISNRKKMWRSLFAEILGKEAASLVGRKKVRTLRPSKLKRREWIITGARRSRKATET